MYGVEQISNDSVNGGAFADIYKAALPNGDIIALKRVRPGLIASKENAHRMLRVSESVLLY